ncbi:MAG: T9SS type A sorting domain-containing protein [Rhodothermales bacterium]|mgnify:CR=1 FL=1|nr:T9SS type A sorting domain-containing protein [Rhodothermales bacterium]
MTRSGLPRFHALWLVLVFAPAGLTRAQGIPLLGSPGALDVATWNIEWFGDSNNGPSNNATQLENVRAVIAGLGIDLWGVQEIADPDDFAALVSALGPNFDGRLATNSVSQRIGFIYDTRVIRLRSVRHILEDFETPFASRPPLQLEADVLLPDTTVVVTFIVVHMKAFSDVDSYERRVEAARRLKNHIDFTSLASKPVVILGDFNDEMDGSITAGRASPYTNFVENTADYRVVSRPIELAGGGSFCDNANCTATGSMIDHLIVTDELFGWTTDGATQVVTELPSVFILYENTTSDHLPVATRLVPPSATAVEHAGRALTASLDAPYPNPFSATTSIAVTLSVAGPVRLAVYDVLGREVAVIADATLPAGRHVFSFAPAGLPSGIYLIRGRNGEARRLVYLP